MLPRNILVPTDFSEGADQALDYAIELAAKLGATIHLVNVVGIPMLGVPELGVALAGASMDSIVIENQTLLDRLAERKGGSAKIDQKILRSGDTRDSIVQAAADVHADLIVMGTHGRRGVTRALLGSIAETVVRTAPCPVLTVRTHDAG